MIEKMHLLSEEDDYKRFNKFEISDELKDILRDDYHLYSTSEFKYKENINKLYDENFINKYDPSAHKEIYDTYINNESFINKAKFIYSIIDEKKYKEFAEKNNEIETPNDITIKYTIADSTGVNVVMYHISIVDISFVF